MQADAEDANLDDDVELDAVTEVNAGQKLSTLEHDTTEGILDEDTLQTTKVADGLSALSIEGRQFDQDTGRYYPESLIGYDGSNADSENEFMTGEQHAKEDADSKTTMLSTMKWR